MGGNAFATVLGSSSFPRMPPAVYTALKIHLLPQLQKLYRHVAVPFEAPEKTSYGDIDFVVTGPKLGVDPASIDDREGVGAPVNVPHTIVQNAIGAIYMNPKEGNRTSNFAVPIARGGWKVFNHGKDEDEARQVVEGGDIFYQVDVNVCADREEFERIVFFHAYGDLGMIMSLVARNVGLALGEKGLRIPNPPHPHLDLCRTFDEITKFMGWPMDAWKAGFRTKREAFEWAGSSRFFNPEKFRTHGVGFSKVKAERAMYGEFVEWALEKCEAEKAAGSPRTEENEESEVVVEEDWREVRHQTLLYFNKKEEFDAIAHEHDQRSRLKQVFSGSIVRDWTGLGEHWRGVKLIMDAVRERYGGDEGVLKLYDQEGEQAVKRVVLEAKEQLALTSNEDYQRRPEAMLAKAVDNLATAVEKLAVAV